MPRGNGGIIGPVNTSFSGVWSLTEAQLRRSANTWPNFYAALLSESATGTDVFSGSDPSDPYFEYTTLLLPGNGTNGAQNNTFLDGSTNNFTITRNGNTTQGTFSPFSQTGWGNYFSGGANYLNVAAASSIDLASSDFTIECWAYPGTQTNSVDAVFGYGGFATMLYRNGTTWSWEVGNGSSANYFTITATVTPNAWQHIALTRSGNTFTFWLNGVSANINSTTNAVGTASKNLTIGYNNAASSAQYFTGYISNFRIVKGTAVYTSNFTPPTAPLTAISNTSLLTCQSNRFIDTNTQLTAKTITLTGSPSVVSFSPFNPTSAWSDSTVGGSGYFDGSGDYLTAPDNAAFNLSGDFTVEAWVYVFNVSGEKAVFHNHTSDFNGIVLSLDGAAVRLLSGNGSWQVTINSSISINANTWNHIAGTRNGNTFTVWVNGFLGGTANSSATPTYSSGVQIGRFTSGLPLAFNGYILNLRVVKGTAVYTGAFTPPTAPITNAGSTSAASYPSTTNVNTSFASSATSLLLNFTNAGIYDATSKNDLETVGNAQISTTQSKWGGSSISFDGTGDWLLIPDQPPQRIGTGNFTVEMWVYRNSSGTYGLAGKGTGTTGWLVSLNSSNQVVFTYGSSTITSSGTVSATTWTHIAVVREGTSTNQTKIYISGTNDGTGTVSTDFNQTNSMYIGADRTGGSAANAYVQDVRITNYARYTSNFTAPTAAFPTL